MSVCINSEIYHRVVLICQGFVRAGSVVVGLVIGTCRLVVFFSSEDGLPLICVVTHAGGAYLSAPTRVARRAAVNRSGWRT